MRRGARGFTLLEVMVALAVVAIALTAVVGALGQQARLAGALRERTLATFVVTNAAALETLGLAPAEADYTLPMAGRRWPVQRSTDAAVTTLSVRESDSGGVMARCRLPRPPEPVP